MPSRPVLIGRGLVLQTLNKNLQKRLASTDPTHTTRVYLIEQWLGRPTVNTPEGRPQELRRP